MSEYVFKHLLDTSDADATAADILSGKTAYVNGEKVIGTNSGLIPLVVNDTSITPTGSYATSSFYNTDYGVKIGYMADGNILLSMKGGTNVNYEKLRFVLASAPSGVTLEAASNATSSSVSGSANLIYACVLKGIAQKVNISITMNEVNGTYDYTTCAITVTAA